MIRLIDLSAQEAKNHFLKGSSYFNNDFPPYISFEPIITEVELILAGNTYDGFKARKPDSFSNVNYSLISNKDGRFNWRPYELIHPAIYVSLVNVICNSDTWSLITRRINEFEDGIIECCSWPVVSTDNQTDTASQVRNWWQRVEQRSLIYSLEYSHMLHTDVTDCYGSLYTHSIAWAIHGLEFAKGKRNDRNLPGNQIDNHIRGGRYGQTNGISQGSVLMDFIAELVLGYVDLQIHEALKKRNITDIQILRYRDDYRVFSNSDKRAEEVLKIISDKLLVVGMKLGASKTYLSQNVIEGSIKADKLAGLELQDLGQAHAKTIQKQLLRLHSFGRRFPNSGALRRLIGDFHKEISKLKGTPEDLEVQIAIATDIAIVSPITFPAVAGILSKLISLAPQEEKINFWDKVHNKMKQVPYNGYLETWLQRVTIPKSIGINYPSKEAICKIVNGDSVDLWYSDWISGKKLKSALDPSKIVVSPPNEIEEIIPPKETALFVENAWSY